MATTNVLRESNLPGLRLLGRGKVRDIYDLGDQLLIVATDRISAYDVVLPTGIPDKGKVLTGLSAFWFRLLGDRFPNHMVTTDLSRMPGDLDRFAEDLEGRTMMVKKLKVLPVECVVRGYLSGSGWVDYQRAGSVCGVKLPPGLVESDRLEEPIFTPATKAETGHDENIDINRVAAIVGRERAEELKEKTIALYREARAYAEARGIILCDTKLEWGVADGDGPAVVADEVLTPDSSRFWPLDAYKPGGPQPSFDKQYVRDYLNSIRWDRTPPAPELPDDVVEETARKYREIHERLVGRPLDHNPGS